jgi:hypothetical protein
MNEDNPKQFTQREDGAKSQDAFSDLLEDETPEQTQPAEAAIEAKKQNAIIAVLFLLVFGGALIAMLQFISGDRSVDSSLSGVDTSLAEGSSPEIPASSNEPKPPVRRSGLFDGAQSAARDAKREADIKSAHASIEAYFALWNQGYPSFQQINDPAFTKEYLDFDIQDDFLVDPLAEPDAPRFAPVAEKWVYGYRTVPESCDGASVRCIGYELKALLENGSEIVRENRQ